MGCGSSEHDRRHDADSGSGSGGGAIEARFKSLEEQNAKLRREMGEIAMTVKDIGTNMNARCQELLQGQQQGMAAHLARIQGTDASVAMVGHAVAGIPGASFEMPAPTAAAVTGYGGGGGMIADAAGADAAMNGAPNEVAEAVTETALVAATPQIDPHLGDAHYRQADPRLVGAPYPPAETAAPGGVATHIGAPMCPEHSDGLDDGELPALTEAAVETRLQRLKRIALFLAGLLAAPSASDEAGGTMERYGRRRMDDAPPGWRSRRRRVTTTALWSTEARHRARLKGRPPGRLQRTQRVERRVSQADR